MPENAPSISIIIPAYNQAPYVAKAVQSVLKQTRSDFELIVVDDGSTDETSQVLAGMQDSRMRVVRQPNGGLSAARNTGLRESSAPFVSFLDADDCFLNDKLEVLSRYLLTHAETGLVVGRARYIDHGGNTISESREERSDLSFPELLLSNPICVSGVLLRRVWLDRIGVFDERLRACEDWDLWLRLLAAGCQMAWVDHPVVAYRIHPGQMTHQSERMRKAILTVLDKFFSQPGLPEHLRTYRNIAYGTGLVHASAYAYLSDEPDQGARDLRAAVCYDPTLADDGYKRLVSLLVSWSTDPRLVKPDHFIQRIIANPPPGLAGFKLELHRAMADMILGTLFQAPPTVRRNRRHDFLKVLRYRPEWLLNRGVLRMLMDAWLPS